MEYRIQGIQEDHWIDHLRYQYLHGHGDGSVGRCDPTFCEDRFRDFAVHSRSSGGCHSLQTDLAFYSLFLCGNGSFHGSEPVTGG